MYGRARCSICHGRDNVVLGFTPPSLCSVLPVCFLSHPWKTGLFPRQGARRPHGVGQQNAWGGEESRIPL